MHHCSSLTKWRCQGLFGTCPSNCTQGDLPSRRQLRDELGSVCISSLHLLACSLEGFLQTALESTKER